MNYDWEHISLLLDIVVRTAGQAQFAKIHAAAVAELTAINDAEPEPEDEE